MPIRQKDIVLTARATINNNQGWHPCDLILTRRYLFINVNTNSHLCIPIPSINDIPQMNMMGMNQYGLQINSNSGIFPIGFDDLGAYEQFKKNIEEICLYSRCILNREQDFLFANVDEGILDPAFKEIIEGLYSCTEYLHLKKLLGRINEYQKNLDVSLGFVLKPIYIRFVECLRYISDAIATDELMRYAEELIAGFDDILDDANAGDTIKPEYVNIGDKFKMESAIGKGKFGFVYRCRYLENNRVVALKRIEKKNMSNSQFQEVLNEASVMYKLRNHPHIIGLLGFYEDDYHYYIAQPLMYGGELFHYICNNGFLSEAQAQQIIFTLVNTLEYAHQRGVVHRDLKPENILLRERNNIETVCIMDFGLSHLYDFGNTLDSYCGTPGYIAPEVIKREKYGSAVDMWSLGVIAYIL